MDKTRGKRDNINNRPDGDIKMTYYAINHYVVQGDEPMQSTVYGDDSLAVWVSSDPKKDPPDHSHEQPAGGWTWVTDKDGFKQHPSVLDQYDGEIERRTPWETTLTEGVSQG
jgi:hypothetical protein